jgi:SAM-dependent methyltransferase
MYQLLKGILKACMPDKFMLKTEPVFRSMLYFFYRGNTYQCGICGKGLRKFVDLPGGDRLCPNCGSLGRTRRLWDLLQQGYLGRGARVLDFSPSRCLHRQMKRNTNIRYTSTDFVREFPSDQQYDITDIAAPQGSFDLILCYHVLEHVENDSLAMKELYRVLDNGGTCIVQTPFTKGPVYENADVTTPEERKRHFGQADHVRIYSVEGLKDRLEKAGFRVEVKEYHVDAPNREGFNSQEYILIAGKTPTVYSSSGFLSL